jgi:hypothetical protein
MPAVNIVGAERINAARAGLTGNKVDPSQESGAPLATSPTELLDQIPTEFGGLTHLFGGGSNPVAENAPVNTALTAPGGTKGPLGGRVPDFRNAATKAVATVKDAASTVTSNQPAASTPSVPLSTSAKNTVAKVRGFLKI